MDENILLTDGDTPPVSQASLSSWQPNILPDSRLRNPKTAYAHIGLNWEQIFCANCGASGGYVPEENCNFAFYLCQPCADRLGPIDGTYMEPDAVFWAKVKEAQIEKFGRELTAPEMVEALKDEHHILSKLARERKK